MGTRLPKKIWLAGKGPSLDSYDWSKADWCRIGLNETAFLIPQCWAAFACDFPVLEKYLKLTDTYIFRKKTCELRFTKEIVWDSPGIECFATAPTAVQVLHGLGVEQIHFVGFDSVSTRDSEQADCIKKIDACGTNSDGYHQINLRLIKHIRRLGIVDIWEHLS